MIIAGKLKDISGMIYNNVQVISFNSVRINSNGRKIFLWNCVCPVCKNIFIANGSSLKANDIKQCEKCRNPHKNTDAFINRNFGKLTVLELTKEYNSIRGSLCKCKCECGKTTYVYSRDLISGNTKSCGCLNKDSIKNGFTDLTGKTFKYAFVLRRIQNKLAGHQSVVWYECKCLKCNRIFETRGSNLTNGHTTSCGCTKRKSKGETFIEFYLNKMNVSFKHNYWFNDLRSNKNFPLMFDFGIFNKKNELICLIEFQGEQHYKPQKTESFGLYQREISDKLKKQYCKNNSLKLYEIKYDENIVEKLIEILNKIHYEYTVPSSLNKEKV